MTRELHWGSASHQGHVRKHNEDAVLAGPCVFAVADGMGGHAGGEVASAIAVAELASIQNAEISAVDLISALDRTNAEIIRRARAGDGPNGMGTTIAGLATGSDGLVVFNLGDSRVYRFRNGDLVQLTEDHSLVAEMVRDGLLTESGARTHPKRNVVTRALGVEESIEPAVFTVDSVTDDVFIVASDGLFNEVGPHELTAILEDPGPVELTARQLLDAALRNGGRDNVSVVVIRVGEASCDSDLLEEDTNPSRMRSPEEPPAPTSSAPEQSTGTLITSVPGFGPGGGGTRG